MMGEALAYDSDGWPVLLTSAGRPSSCSPLPPTRSRVALSTPRLASFVEAQLSRLLRVRDRGDDAGVSASDTTISATHLLASSRAFRFAEPSRLNYLTHDNRRYVK